MSHLFEIEPEFDRRYDVPIAMRDLLLRESVSTIEFVEKDDEGKKIELGWGSYPVVDADTLAQLGTGWKIKRVIANGTVERLAAFGQRNTTVVNERCHVAVAGLGLLTVDEVENHNDLCTNELQRKLDDGWRILAVCVQPDQRRPDYVLGRTRAKEGANGK